jgi:hypothetical protein
MAFLMGIAFLLAFALIYQSNMYAKLPETAFCRHKCEYVNGGSEVPPQVAQIRQDFVRDDNVFSPRAI